MKTVNLIVSLSPHQQRTIYLWYCISTIMFIGMIVALVFFSIHPVMHFLYIRQQITTLHERTANYAMLVKQKEELEKKYQSIRDKKNKIVSYQTNKWDPASYLNSIMQCDPSICENIHITKGMCEIIIHHQTMNALTKNIHILAESTLFDDVHLAHISHDVHKKEFRCTLKGKIAHT